MEKANAACPEANEQLRAHWSVGTRGGELFGAAELLDLIRAGTAPIILEPDIDDQPRAERGGDQNEDQRVAVEAAERTAGQPQPQPA